MNTIGFMQGRLSPIVDGKIQAFPWKAWRYEFKIAKNINLNLVEWTLDQEDLYKNPLLTQKGQDEIKNLCRYYNIGIPSLTGDCFMQDPFWRSLGEEQNILKKDFQKILEACISVGISIIVVPLVDNGRLNNFEEEDVLIDFLKEIELFLNINNLQIAFESDFNPKELNRFICRLNPSLFGINYDIGNSAALGFDSTEEIDLYGNRIINVHVKDRVLGGTTVPLGTGDADFEKVFSNLKKIGYKGNYILQTARANDGNHSKILDKFKDMTIDWIERYGS
jgi:L-ribulose-5-phosphate 3-epimerase